LKGVDAVVVIRRAQLNKTGLDCQADLMATRGALARLNVSIIHRFQKSGDLENSGV